MNKCIFLGRFTKDPEVRRVGDKAMAITNFTLAVDRKFKKEGQPTADFLNFVAMDKTAEIIERYCTKGSMISVVSRVQTRSWDGTDGKKHFATEFVVEEFSFAGGNKSENKKPASQDEEFVL